MNTEKLQYQLESKRSELASALEAMQANPTAELKEKVSALVLETKALGDEFRMVSEAHALAMPVALGETKGDDSWLREFQKIVELKSGKMTLEQKAMTTLSGFPGPKTRSGVMLNAAAAHPNLYDYLDIRLLGSPQASYLQMTTRTNNASAFGEGNSPTANAYVVADTSFDAKPITATFEISKQSYNAQNPEAIAWLRDTLMEDLKRELVRQFVSAGDWNSISAVSGVSTGAVASGLYFDAINTAIGTVHSNGSDVDVIVMNSTDWSKFRNLKDSQNRPIFNPTDPVNNLYGIPLVMDANLATGTVYAFASRDCPVGLVGDIEFEVGYSGTGFASRTLTAIATIAGNVAVKPKAVYKITSW